jgi:hypothetical protein
MNLYTILATIVTLYLVLNVHSIHTELDNGLDYSLETQQQQLPVRIIKHPESQIASHGSRVTFKCEYEITNNNQPQLQSIATNANENLNVKIKWLHNLNPIKFDNYLIERNNLIILNYEPNKHSGQFRCLINNTLFSPPLVILSQPANLSLAYIENFEQQQTTSTTTTQLNLSEGNVAIIACKLPYSNPTAIPIFYLNETILSIQQNVNDRYKLFPSGNLQISNLKFMDSGIYRCGAKNPVTNEIKNSSKKVNLKVFEPFGTKMPEIVYVPVDTNRIQIGANLTLECVANGAPVPLVSWEKFGGILPEKRSQQIFGNLIITNVQPEDKGTYVCRAENGPGQATFKTAMVDVFEAPTLIKSEDDVKFTTIAKQGDTIDLKCPIRSRPRSDISWFYQGQKLIENISTFGDKSILTVRNFQSSKSTGIYQCYAQNEYGFEQANLLLIPFESIQSSSSSSDIKQRNNNNNQDSVPKRPVIIMGPQNTTIYEGQTVVLLCITSETSSGGNTQINWLQNELIIEPTLMRRFEINQLLGNLRIVSIQKSDAGIYKCIASNEFGMSTAEAYVNVKSSSEINSKINSEDETKSNNNKQLETIKKEKSQQSSPVASKPMIQQIGTDKILLKWQLIDSLSGVSIENKLDTLLNNIAYFKVEYKTNKQASKSSPSNTWLTIDEQIDPKKREYILTDLNRFDVYRFRITTFFMNGDLTNSHNSLKFKLEQTWSPLSTSSTLLASTSSSSSSSKISTDLKLSQIKVQITQIWAISSSSLGLRWQMYLPNGQNLENKSTDSIISKLNGFYIYYRKIGDELNENKVIEASNDPTSNLIDPQSVPTVPLFNYTRINVPISNSDNLKEQQQIVDTYIIANLDHASQYEIKMTCYNLNGDLCSFSNTLYGLTLAQTTIISSITKSHVNQDATTLSSIQDSANKAKQNEILFMILGVVLGVLILLLVIFIGMCIVRQRQHKLLLAQLHNTSQKLTSSSCPTLIYEDSLRNQQNQQHRQLQNANLNYTAKLIEANLFANTTNDSNSTNSQSMSTTTSSMTTPPALISAQTNNDNNNMSPAHIVLLNGNTVTTTSGMHPPPPIPQHPPPQISGSTNTSTMNRININLNPLNGYLDAMSPNKAYNLNKQHQQQQQPHHNNENFYHTLTALGNLPNTTTTNIDENLMSNYVDYNNTTLNLRAHLLLKQQQQQQQQQILMNTLKQINMQKQLNHFNSINGILVNENSVLNNENNNNNNNYAKSPSASSMRRNNSINSSKKSKKSLKNKQINESNVQNDFHQMLLQQQQQQLQNKNYYLLPNMLAPQGPSQPIYNENDLLNIEAALNMNQISLFANAANINPNGIYLINQTQFNPYTQALIQQQQQQAQLSPNRNFQINNTNSNNDFDSSLMFKPVNENVENSIETPIYEENEERENHYASTGLMIQEQENEPLKK